MNNSHTEAAYWITEATISAMCGCRLALVAGLLASSTLVFGQEPENSVVFRDEDQPAAACFVWDYVDYIEDTRSPFFICVDANSHSRMSIEIRSEDGWALVFELTSDKLTFGQFGISSLDDDSQPKVEYGYSAGDSHEAMGFVWDRIAVVDIDESVLDDMEASEWIAFRVNNGVTRRVRLPDAREAVAEFRGRLALSTTYLNNCLSVIEHLRLV